VLACEQTLERNHSMLSHSGYDQEIKIFTYTHAHANTHFQSHLEERCELLSQQVIHDVEAIILKLVPEGSQQTLGSSSIDLELSTKRR